MSGSKPKKKEVDHKALKLKLIEKTVKDPYWGTGLSGGVNISDKH